MNNFRRSVLVILFILIFMPLYSQDYSFECFKEGVDHFNKMEYEASIDFFRKAIGLKPTDSGYRFFLGLAYYKAGYDENAIFEFKNILENSNDEIVRNLINYLTVKRFLLGSIKKAEDYTMDFKIEENNLERYILSKTTGIDVDDSGNIYTCGFGSKIALKLSSQGDPVRCYTSPKIEQGRLYDVALDNKENLYISDFTNDVVYKFENNGRYLRNIGSSGFEEGKFYGPTSIAVDRDNNIYVVDSGNSRIEKFSENGEFLLSFGKEGEYAGDFSHISGIAVDYNGKIFVADHGKKVIGIYDNNGNYITNIGKGVLVDPYGISFAFDNRLIVSDGNSIKSYDIMHSDWKTIDTKDYLKRVLDVKYDRMGGLYACDYESNEIYRFIPKEDKYRNLNIILEKVDVRTFPTVVYSVTVQDADGLPVYGLKNKNFLLKIGGGKVNKIDLSYNDVRDSKLDILFIIDKSVDMQNCQNEVESYINQFISRVSKNDELAVISFNSDSWIASSFTTSKLRTMDAITEKRYKEGRAFDKAFRRGIDYLNKKFYKKVVIVITDGKLDENSFKNHSFESCINYASNSHIPVYFLSFGEHDSEKLNYFAKRTGGKFYNVLHSNDFPFLYSAIKDYRSSEYIIYFNDTYDPKLKGMYLDAEVEVDFHGRIGKNRLGFIYP